MPTISSFYGMIIKMYFQQSEHSPPHFHVVYGEYVGLIDIATLHMLEGDLPARALALVQEWARAHQDELSTMWHTQEFTKIPPLQ